MRLSLGLVGSLGVVGLLAVFGGCSASGNSDNFASPNGGASGSAGSGGSASGKQCDTCTEAGYVPCTTDGKPGDVVPCESGVCAEGTGCVNCGITPTFCVGTEIHACDDTSPTGDKLVQDCANYAGQACLNGVCTTGCVVAENQPSNVGCEFWAVDLDQQDGGGNDPASAPWGVVLSNAGDSPAVVKIELNNALYAQPLVPTVVTQVTVNPGDLQSLELPTRELDCGVKPNDYNSPGTCISSRAFRITSTAPIVAYQFNVFTNTYSNDASLLLPTNALGKVYRVVGWPAGHPAEINIGGLPKILDRSYVTIVGVKPNTQVKVRPSWNIKGNGPIPATPKGGTITATLGPFDVLNLETDNATLQDDPKTVADLSGTLVQSSEPVVVFSGVESTGAPGSVVEIPTPPGWTTENTCCLDHLEDQMFPVESVGTNYVIARSPVRSTTGFREPDILRFVGAAEQATVTTNLPAPFDTFNILPGEVKTTWTQNDVVITATKPVMVGQILVSNQYVDGANIGDPSLTVFPPVDQFRTEYVILTPGSWSQNWVVISAEVGSSVTLDGTDSTSCLTESAGTIGQTNYESRRCPLSEGVHRMTGDKPFGITAYGYGNAGSYAFVGGADVKKVYTPPDQIE